MMTCAGGASDQRNGGRFTDGTCLQSWWRAASNHDDHNHNHDDDFQGHICDVRDILQLWIWSSSKLTALPFVPSSLWLLSPRWQSGASSDGTELPIKSPLGTAREGTRYHENVYLHYHHHHHLHHHYHHHIYDYQWWLLISASSSYWSCFVRTHCHEHFIIMMMQNMKVILNVDKGMVTITTQIIAIINTMIIAMIKYHDNLSALPQTKMFTQGTRSGSKWSDRWTFLFLIQLSSDSGFKTFSHQPGTMQK